MYNKPPLCPAPLWLYYFNVRDINAAAERVTAGGGDILEGPVEVPNGNWIVRCADPQGAMFALEGKPYRGIGHFAPAAPRVVNTKRE
jgi:hypothetical protein